MDDFFKEYRRTGQKVKKIRGHVINEFLDIECLIENLIERYYVQFEKENEFHFHVMPRISTRTKIGILRYILSESKYKSMFKKIRRMLEIRNLVAHSMNIIAQTKIIVPRKTPSMPPDLEDLKKEFDKLYKELFNELSQISV